MENEQVEVRRAKLDNLAKSVQAYPERYEVTHKLSDIASLEDGVDNVSIAGRILSIRKMGKLAFVHLSDIEGRAQISIKLDVLGEEKFKFFFDNINTGVVFFTFKSSWY